MELLHNRKYLLYLRNPIIPETNLKQTKNNSHKCLGKFKVIGKKKKIIFFQVVTFLIKKGAFVTLRKHGETVTFQKKNT